MEVFAVVLVPLVTGAFATVWLLPLCWLVFCLLVPRDKIPVITDWATVLIWMWQKHILSPHWNFCSERPGRASVCPPLQSIKRSLNVNFCFVSFTHFTLRIRLQCTGNNIRLDLLSGPWQYRDKWSTRLCQNGPSADDTSPDTTHRHGKVELLVTGQPVD